MGLTACLWLGCADEVRGGADARSDAAGSGGVVCPPQPQTLAGVTLPIQSNALEQVDLLLEVDNSNATREIQTSLARSLRVLIDQLVNPPINPMTMLRQSPPLRSLQVGVISTDLGTPGSMVPSCANSDGGDDGLLNPIRNGLALRQHQPWTTLPPGIRPARCENRLDQYPSFLRFDAVSGDPAAFAEDFVCNAVLSHGGCGLPQQLESAYRALVIRQSRAGIPGNMDPNAGFVRDDAVLAIVLVTPKEDGSVLDCRYREPGDPDGVCPAAGSGSRLGVFDSTNPNWSSADLNLRFYLYQPGGAQDPTWPLNRYIDPMRPNRGFTSLKPGRPDLVVFSAITGVPINLPQTVGDAPSVDWTALLGAASDGSQGLVAMSPEGPVSMRQSNLDPNCSNRVVPACRQEGSAYDPAVCDGARQPFAWPSRRIAEVARRFAVTYRTGAVSSICRNDFGDALAQVGRRVQNRLGRLCLPRSLQTMGTNGSTRVECVVEETLPSTVRAATWCVPARGRRPGGVGANGRERCVVNQLSAVPGQPPPAGDEGFFFDTRPDPDATGCTQRISFTANAGLAPGASAAISCVDRTTAAPSPSPQCGTAAVGAPCDPPRPGSAACDPARGELRGCFSRTEFYLGVGSRECASGLCVVNGYNEADEPNPNTGRARAERARRVHCTCRCSPLEGLASTVDPRELCACPSGFQCRANAAGPAFGVALAGGYCVRDGT